MKKYKVLWFDDEFEKLETIKDDALINDILLIGYNNATDGLIELESNLFSYDAVIVDGKFYTSSANTGDAVDDTAMVKVARALDKLEDKKKIPWYILSGQLSFTKEINPYATAYKNNKVYDKNKDEHFDELWAIIKLEADQQQDTQIRHENQDVFSIFSLGYLPKELEQQVLELIESPVPLTRVEIKAMLANIRSIHESCLLKLKEIKVIPNSLEKFSAIIKHLSGNKTKENKYQPTTKEYQNDAIENLNEWLYFTCGKYIHNLNDENYKGYMISRYAVESLRSGVLELLLWYKKIYQECK